MMRRPANRYRDSARTVGVNFGKNKKFTFVLLLVAVVYVYINSVFTVVEDIGEQVTANTLSTDTGEINNTHNIHNSHENSNGGTDHDNSFDVNNGVDDMSPFEHGTETAQTEYESDNTQEGDEVLNEEKDQDQTEETATEDEDTTGNRQEEQDEESTTDKATDEAVSEESTEAVDGETTEAADGGSTENKIDEVDTNEGGESKIEAVSSEVGACESNPFAAALDKSFEELTQMLSSTEVETAEEDANDHVVEKEEIEATEQDKDDLNVEDKKEDEDAKFFSSVTSSTETTDQDEVVANVEDEDAKFFSSVNSSTETVKQEDNESPTLFSSGNDSTILRETNEESVRRNLRGRNKSTEKEDKEEGQEKEDDEENQENEDEEEAKEEEPKETSNGEGQDESKMTSDGEGQDESLEMTDEEQDQESKETTDGEEEESKVTSNEESKETSDLADSISVKCATESKYSVLPGICGLENHMKGEENDGHCNYVIAYSELDSNKHFTLLQETNCNIFVTQLCSEDEPIAFNKEEEYERLTFLENMCLKPSMTPTKEDEVDAVIRRLESATTDSFDLTEIDLLYIELPKDESSSQGGLFESYVDTTRFYFMSMGEDSTIVKSVNSPMQMVLNNVKEVAQVRENLQTKAMANGLIIIDGAETDDEKESSSLTLMRFTCPPPKEAPMGGSAHFVGAGFPV